MQRINIDRGWKVSKERPAPFFPNQGKQNGEKEVNLPHDCNLDEPVTPDCPDGRQTAYFKGNMAVYTKRIEIPEEWRGQKIFLQLDGAYCNTEITANGHLIAAHPNGYAPFTADLTDYLYYGEENRIAVFVNHSMMRTSRWYSGTGIYRHVDLLVGPGVHLTEQPLFLVTERIGRNQAVIRAEAEIKNETDAQRRLTIKVELFEDRGRGEPLPESPAAAAAVRVIVPPNSTGIGTVRLVVPEPKLWDIEHPNLYVAVCTVYEKEQELDRDQTLCGVRTISADPVNGLMLNGSTVKIRGGCMHHDNGILGAASFYDSEYRRLKYHKEHGYNGIRGAHNPMSRDMLEACDRLGLLMFAEAFDVWRMAKNVNDYHLSFEDWWKRDITAFIKRDRNHPCIFTWSIGNEIVERNGLKDGAGIAAMLTESIHALDPSRPVSAAVPSMFNGMDDKDARKQLECMMAAGGPGQNTGTEFSGEIWADRTEGFCAPLDIVGYNYLEDRYEEDHKRYPERVICGTESLPANIDRIWELVEKLPYVIGDFTWSSQDYLGETTCGNIIYRGDGEPPVERGELQAGRFPGRTAHCSDFDICGNELPSLHYRKIVWGSSETYLAVMDPKNYGKTAYRTGWAWDECENRWCWPGYEGKPVAVEVYSAAEEVELVINGVSAGRRPAGKSHRYKAVFDTVYEPGWAEAISFEGGREVSRQRIKTPGQPAGLRLKPDQTVLRADGQSLAFVSIELTDAKGNVIPYYEETLSAAVEGAGELAGFGSANPVTEELYTTGTFTAYKGRLLAVVRSGFEPGTLILRISGSAYGERKLRFTVR